MKKSKLTNAFLQGISLSTLLISTSLVANYSNPSSIDISLTGAGFRPTTENGGFAIAAPNAVTVPPSGNYVKVDPKTDFGGAVSLGYHFASSPYVLALSYWGAHFDENTSTSGNIAVTNAPATFGFDFASAASSKLDFKNDIVNFLLGATYHPDCHFTIIPKAGLTYLHLKNNTTTRYAGLNIPAGATLVIEEPSVFKGIGPSIGADLDYNLGLGFSLFSNLTYSAIIGDIHSHYKIRPIDATVPAVDVNVKSGKSIVNLFQSELAIAYRFLCCNTYSGQLLVGYTLAKEFGTSENNYNFTDDVGDSLFVSDITNTGFHGFFGRVNFNFDV